MSLPFTSTLLITSFPSVIYNVLVPEELPDLNQTFILTGSVTEKNKYLFGYPMQTPNE